MVDSCNCLAYCRIVAGCRETVLPFIASPPPRPNSSPATGRSSRWSVAAGNKFVSHRSPPPHTFRAHPLVRRAAADAPRRHRYNSDRGPFRSPLAARCSRAAAPVAVPRSWQRFQPVSLVVALASPRSDPSWPTSVLALAIAPAESNPQRLLVSSSRHPDNVPDPALSAADRSSVRAGPRIVLGATSPRTRRAPWPAPPLLPATEPSRSWSALSRSHSRSLWETKPRPDRSLRQPAPADVPALASSPRPLPESVPQSCAVHPHR